MNFAQKAFNFYTKLSVPSLPQSVEAMNPYQHMEVQQIVRQFFNQFYSDNHKRVYVFGINPGRFGAGLTGVTFTDPVALQEYCGIPNPLPQRRETSSIFVYDFIQRWGGTEKFYSDFFLTAVCPLGFMKEGKNYNFYDHPDLLRALHRFLLQTLSRQVSFGAQRDAAIVLGSGKNYQIFCELNKEGRFFRKLYALEHPRFIMQYRRKRLETYLQKYETVFREVLK